MPDPNTNLFRTVDRVFPRRSTSGGFLKIGYCSRTISYCFPYCFLGIFVTGDKVLMEGDKVVIGGSPVPRENPG